MVLGWSPRTNRYNLPDADSGSALIWGVHVAAPVRLVLLALIAGMLTFVSAPAQADLVLRQYDVLPLTSRGETLAVPSRNQMLFAGEADEVVVLDLATGVKQQVPGSAGVRTLSLSKDGGKVYGATGRGDALVVIDLDSVTAERFDVPAASCPTDAVGRAGRIFYVAAGEDCYSFGRLMALDLATGETTEITPPPGMNREFRNLSLDVVPGADRLVATEINPGTEMFVYDVSGDGAATLVAQRRNGDTVDRAFVTDDGSEVALATFASGSTSFLNVSDLSDTGRSVASDDVVQATPDVAVVLDYNGVSLMRRSDGLLVNRYVPPLEDDVDFGGPRLVGTTLHITGWRQTESGPERGLYTVEDALSPSRSLTVREVGDELVGVPMQLTGRLTFEGEGLGGASVILTQILPTKEALGTVVTDGDGTWSTEYVPRSSDVGRLVTIEASHEYGAQETVARAYVSPEKRVTELTLQAPERVPGEAVITVDGVIEDNAQPFADAPVTITHRCQDPLTSDTAVELVADRQGAFSFDLTAGTCRYYRFEAGYGGDASREPTSAVTGVWVDREPSTLRISSQPGETALPGEELTFEISLSDSAGKPVPGAELELTRRGPDTKDVVTYATTDDAGKIVRTIATTVEGYYSYTASWDGDPRLGPSYWSDGVTVKKAATSLSLEAPPSVKVGETFTLSGQLTGAPLPADLTLDGSSVDARSISTDEDGRFAFSTSSDVAGYTHWWVNYAGDETHASAQASRSVRINQWPTELTLEAPKSALVDEAFTLSGQLTGAPLPADLTVLEPGGTSRTTSTDAEGRYRLEVSSPRSGERSWTVRYDGDSTYAADEASTSVTIGKRSTTLTAQAPTTAHVSEQFEISGQLVGVDGAAEITVREPDGARLQATTGDDGSFAVATNWLRTGVETWTISYAGDDRHQAAEGSVTVDVEKFTPTLSIRTDRFRYTAGEGAEIRIGMSEAHDRRVVVTAKQYGRPAEVIYDAGLNPSGIILYREMKHTEVYRVRSFADYAQEAASVEIRRAVRPQLRTEPKGRWLGGGRYVLYGRNADPVFLSESYPARPDSCLRHQLQRFRGGSWRDVRTSVCKKQSSSGAVRWQLRGDQPLKVGYRVRALFAGDELNLPAKARWVYFRFE